MQTNGARRRSVSCGAPPVAEDEDESEDYAARG
jgi:hypothetical protein